jgi:hypothetical protein
MFASSSRLDLNVVVGPVKPRHIKTILSGQWPILIDYSRLFAPSDITGSAVWRMDAVLKRRDRVREISIGGCASGPIFGKFIKASNHQFPALESLVLRIPNSYDELEIPATFLREPDRSDLPLRRLRLCSGSPSFVSRLLLSTTALTNLTLEVTSDAALFELSRGSSLLVCLQRMQCLRSLDLTTPYYSRDPWSESPQDTTVPMSELTRLHYSGLAAFFSHLMSGLSAPSLQDARLELFRRFPLPYLSRVIDDVREEFRSVSISFNIDYTLLLSSTHSDYLKPSSFRLNVNYPPYAINSMRSTPSTKLAMVEELTLRFPMSGTPGWEDASLMRDFLRQFRSVRLLRVNPFVQEIGIYLKQDEDRQEAIFPVLEQVEISISRGGCSDEEYESRVAEALAAFEPCERAGRPVKVCHCERMQMQFMNVS